MTYKNRVLNYSFIGSALILAGQIFSYPNSVRNVVDGSFPSNLHLEYPLAYTVFAPFFQFSDRWTFLSVRQHVVLLVWICSAWILYRVCVHLNRKRSQLENMLVIPAQAGIHFKEFLLQSVNEIALFSEFIVVLVALGAAIILIPRPMAFLRSSDPDILLCDFHSHTNHSWDGRRSFTPEKNLVWHEKAGFDAAFITDHNVFEGSRLSAEKTQNAREGIISMRGEEVSLYRSHWAVLGIDKVISNSRYDNGMDGIHAFLQDLEQEARPVAIASIPEYWLYHWGPDVRSFYAWGVKGFEIVSSVPIALDFPEKLREEMIQFCRKNNLIVTGITDNHGWGSSCYVWNAVKIPGWRQMPRDKVESALIAHLLKERFSAAQVIVRVQAQSPENLFLLALDPLRQIWSACRTMPISQAIVTLFWIWIPCGIIELRVSQ